MTYLERLEGVASLTLPEICVRKKPTFMVHHHKKPRKETIHENFKRYQVHPGTISIHFRQTQILRYFFTCKKTSGVARLLSFSHIFSILTAKIPSEATLPVAYECIGYLEHVSDSAHSGSEARLVDEFVKQRGF